MAEPWTDIDLGRVDPGSTPAAPGDRAATEQALPALATRIGALQDRLWAEARRSLLVVLQAMDAGGKDGTVKHVFGGINPQGVRVRAFKEPTALELRHDFLWRVHQPVPAAGEIVIFNRSHYEDVLVTVVHGGIDHAERDRRLARIREFETLLAGSGTTVVKLFLHISRPEQLRRFQARLDDPTKRWKLQPSDIAERRHWDDYQAAYQHVLHHTDGWRVIPADHKWYRNWAVSTILVDALERIDPHYPPAADLGGVELS